MTMDPQSRQLFDKYRMGESPDPDHPIVQAMLDAKRIVVRSTRSGDDASSLFDPAWSPRMYDLAERTLSNVHHGLGRGGDMRYVNTAGNTLRGPRRDRETYVHFVGDERAFVCKGKPDEFAATLPHLHWLHDIANGCQINIADDCGGATVRVPLLRGRFLLIFACCVPYREQADVMADDGFIISEMDEQADLLPGARIMPNPEPDVNPDAWA